MDDFVDFVGVTLVTCSRHLGHAPRITWILTSMSSESVDLNTMVCEPEKIVGFFSNNAMAE